jgi:hypothetical protein
MFLHKYYDRSKPKEVISQKNYKFFISYDVMLKYIHTQKIYVITY